MPKPPKPPTDLEIMDKIYDEYYATFIQWVKGDKSRETKNYVPIDLQKIADDLGVDGDVIHGRFYSYLGEKYSVEREGKVVVPFFQNKMGEQMHLVQFPVLTSVLADLREQDQKFKLGIRIAIRSMVITAVISTIAIVVSIFALIESDTIGTTETGKPASAFGRDAVEDALPTTN